MIHEPLRSLGSAATIAVILIGLACGACLAGSQGDAAGNAPATDERDARRAEVRFPNDFLVVAEIADTPERVQRGYMFRTKVRRGEGMIFTFGETELHSFWMKNTLVPLDIIWMDDTGSIIYIEADTPPCKSDPCPGYGPMRKSSMVLEVRGGTAASERLKIGDRLRVTIP